MSDKATAPTSILVLDDGQGRLTTISNKPNVLQPDPNTGGYIPGTAEGGGYDDPNFRWYGPPVNFERNPAKADEERRKRFSGVRETAMAAPAPETTAMVIANNFGLPFPFVKRVLDLEQAVTSMAKGIVALQELVADALVDNHELREHIDKLFSRITRP